MKFQGKAYKDGKYWLAEIPILELMTQGHSKKELLVMVEDLFTTLSNNSELEVNVQCDKNGNLEVGTNNSKIFVGLLLKRKRNLNNLTVEEVSKRLGSSSKNSYARYEQGKSLPSFDKLQELLCAVGASSDFVINESKFA